MPYALLTVSAGRHGAEAVIAWAGEALSRLPDTSTRPDALPRTERPGDRTDALLAGHRALARPARLRRFHGATAGGGRPFAALDSRRARGTVGRRGLKRHAHDPGGWDGTPAAAGTFAVRR
ncbi:hypothetical protein [Sphaerisporangium sp. NPDC051011]|uniref:hypothetical protein n=1 Tax=Sphaerisporangium sp. NPDC051011 TaxID=3155792 RepID=UPI0033DB6531